MQLSFPRFLLLLPTDIIQYLGTVPLKYKNTNIALEFSKRQCRAISIRVTIFLRIQFIFLSGRGTRIRTWINGFKVRCAAVAPCPK